MTGWANLNIVLLRYFKPADYTFKRQQSLAKWTQRGSITENTVGFYNYFTQCVDVNEVEALLHFLDGLSGDIQALFHTQKPMDLS